MNLKSFLGWFSNKFDTWLQKVGEENCPTDTDSDVLPDEEPLIRRSDLISDEFGDFDSRF